MPTATPRAARKSRPRGASPADRRRGRAPRIAQPVSPRRISCRPPRLGALRQRILLQGSEPPHWIRSPRLKRHPAGGSYRIVWRSWSGSAFHLPSPG
ncbi:hypothetical protein CENSYa_0423 [Cenarchaeum symbiosum A]|uniref:Uncharacterized protein n=1 Tax=Cenarchaeum symbiosum (strain A) TaxID=414004 RepID=A0RUP1_CENSY|nr:hypothetical protein CENSYa_0423 [Cenarchaeum symbiosum A]